MGASQVPELSAESRAALRELGDAIKRNAMKLGLSEKERAVHPFVVPLPCGGHLRFTSWAQADDSMRWNRDKGWFTVKGHEWRVEKDTSSYTLNDDCRLAIAEMERLRRPVRGAR